MQSRLFATSREGANRGREIQGESFLIAKLPWRRNITSGCVLRCPCFCALASVPDQLLRPAHALWTLIRRRVEPCHPLFRAVKRWGFNRILKAIMHKLHIPESCRYRSHAFRMCNTQELKESVAPGRLSPPLASGAPQLFGDTWTCLAMSRLRPNSFSDVDIDSESEAE